MGHGLQLACSSDAAVASGCWLYAALRGYMLPYVPYQLDWGVEPDEPVRLTVCGLVGDGWWQDVVW